MARKLFAGGSCGTLKYIAWRKCRSYHVREYGTYSYLAVGLVKCVRVTVTSNVEQVDWNCVRPRMYACMCVCVYVCVCMYMYVSTRVGTLIVATFYLHLIQNRYMLRSFTVLHCSHQHCVQPVASDVEVVGYL